MTYSQVLIKNMLYGTSDAEPQTDYVVAQLSQELYNSNLLLLLIQVSFAIDSKLHKWRRKKTHCTQSTCYHLRLNALIMFLAFVFVYCVWHGAHHHLSTTHCVNPAIAPASTSFEGTSLRSLRKWNCITDRDAHKEWERERTKCDCFVFCFFLQNLNRIDFEGKKDVAQVFNNVLRRQIGTRSPTVEYICTKPEILFTLIAG